MRQYDELGAGFADFDRLSEVGAALHGGLEKIRVTVDSADGMVTVVAGGKGDVVELELDPRIYSNQDADALAKTILETIHAAYGEAMNSSLELLDKLEEQSDGRTRPLFQQLQDAWHPDTGRR